MCCLGFLALELGAKKDDVRGVSCPVDVPAAFEGAPWLFEGRTNGDTHSEDGSFLINTNDDYFLPDHHREDRIAAVFARHGWETEFVDGPVTP